MDQESGHSNILQLQPDHSDLKSNAVRIGCIFWQTRSFLASVQVLADPQFQGWSQCACVICLMHTKNTLPSSNIVIFLCSLRLLSHIKTEMQVMMMVMTMTTMIGSLRDFCRIFNRISVGLLQDFYWISVGCLSDFYGISIFQQKFHMMMMIMIKMKNDDDNDEEC